MLQKGKITQIIGPVVDVRFDMEHGQLPKILEAIEVLRPNGQKLILEAQQHQERQHYTFWLLRLVK